MRTLPCVQSPTSNQATFHIPVADLSSDMQATIYIVTSFLPIISIHFRDYQSQYSLSKAHIWLTWET